MSRSAGDFAQSGGDDNTYFARPVPAAHRLHTLKLSPQEQLALALGLPNLNPPATIADE